MKLWINTKLDHRDFRYDIVCVNCQSNDWKKEYENMYSCNKCGFIILTGKCKDPITEELAE